MNKMVSVIIPVYNVEKYLNRCLDSVIQQSYRNIEIILIDDGSTDNSGHICDEYSKIDSRICVFHKSNGGLSEARNLGLDHVHGDFITFIDSDDFVSKWYIEYLITLIKKHNADMAVCQYRESADDSYEFLLRPEDKELICNRKQAFEHYCYQKKIAQNAWGKMYAREIYRETRFTKGILYEDEDIFYKILDKCQKVIIGSQIHYFYYKSADGIIRSKFVKEKYQYVVASIELVKYIESTYPDLYTAALSKLLWSCIHIWVQIPNKKDYPEIYSDIEKIIRKYRKRVLLNPRVRLKNKLLLLLSYGGQKTLRKIYVMKG